MSDAKDETLIDKFVDTLLDDLNTSNAQTVIFEITKYLNQSLRGKDFEVIDIKKSEKLRNPQAPFTTSSLSLMYLGILSPVSADVSTSPVPLITIPSSGIFSPGFMTITSSTLKLHLTAALSGVFKQLLAMVELQVLTLL